MCKRTVLFSLLLVFLSTAYLQAQWYDPNKPIYENKKTTTRSKTTTKIESGNTTTIRSTTKGTTTSVGVSAPSAFDVFNFLRGSSSSQQRQKAKKKETPAKLDGREDLRDELKLTAKQCERLSKMFAKIDADRDYILSEADAGISEILVTDEQKAVWTKWLQDYRKQVAQSRRLHGEELKTAIEKQQAMKGDILTQLNLDEEKYKAFNEVMAYKDGELEQLQKWAIEQIAQVLDDRQEELLQLDSIQHKLRIKE